MRHGLRDPDPIDCRPTEQESVCQFRRTAIHGKDTQASRLSPALLTTWPAYHPFTDRFSLATTSTKISKSIVLILFNAYINFQNFVCQKSQYMSKRMHKKIQYYKLNHSQIEYQTDSQIATLQEQKNAIPSAKKEGGYMQLPPYKFLPKM